MKKDVKKILVNGGLIALAAAGAVLGAKKFAEGLEDYESNPDWDDEDEDEDEGDRLSVYDAAMIWQSNGCEEEYTFGYTEEELIEALQ